MDIDLDKVKELSEEDLDRFLRDLEKQLYHDLVVARAERKNWIIAQEYKGIEK